MTVQHATDHGGDRRRALRAYDRHVCTAVKQMRAARRAEKVAA